MTPARRRAPVRQNRQCSSPVRWLGGPNGGSPPWEITHYSRRGFRAWYVEAARTVRRRPDLLIANPSIFSCCCEDSSIAANEDAYRCKFEVIDDQVLGRVRAPSSTRLSPPLSRKGHRFGSVSSHKCAVISFPRRSPRRRPSDGPFGVLSAPAAKLRLLLRRLGDGATRSRTFRAHRTSSRFRISWFCSETRSTCRSSDSIFLSAVMFVS